MDNCKLKPFFHFFGGKWRASARHYLPPKHSVIVEPFAGSAGFSVRHHDKRVLLYDVDPVICGVWDYLIRVSPAEILSIPDIAMNGTVDDLSVCQEARWLVGFWVNAATATPCKTPSKWMRAGTHPGVFWGERARQRIATQVEAIRHWQIRQSSYADIQPMPHATWFVDPPYQVAGRNYRFGSEGIDFAHLGEWCRALPGQVIVCENDGADWLPFKPIDGLRSRLKTVEAVWLKENAEDAHGSE